MKAITVSVDYSDMLAKTLPRNYSHFQKWLIVTSPTDTQTAELVEYFQARGGPVELYQTDAFYRNGALLNKGLAIEESFDVLGREGWIMVLDADIVLPNRIESSMNRLTSPYRRMCYNPAKWDGTYDWSKYPRYPDKEFAGYCQLFHADDPVLQTRPWYGTDWLHAGGCDSDFQAKWPADKKFRPSWEVLHLGEPAKNWGGVGTANRQKLDALLRQRRRVGDYGREKVRNG